MSHSQDAADGERRSIRHPDHHWIFDHFEPFCGVVPLEFQVDFIGQRTRNEFLNCPPRATPAETAALPYFNEEYFEWIDLLESVHAARDSFTMLELGAGYGRWSVRGALAARREGKPFRLGLAEAEPKHVEWLKTTLADNDISSADYRVFEAAVSGSTGEATFCIIIPEQPEGWFGQFAANWKVGDREVVGDYYGRPLLDLGLERRAIRVPQIPLSSVLSDYRLIDLIDFDLQESEGDAIEEAIDPLSAKVKRLHIGTHTKEIEERLRKVLSDHGWICLRDYSTGQANETPWGLINFVDGVQSWLNPRLA